MASFFEVSFAGGKELQRKLDRLPEAVQRRIIPPIFKRSIQSVANAIALAFSGEIVQERTGRTADAFADLRIRTSRRSADLLSVAAEMPKRSALGIDPKDPYYYPAALEYGFSVGKTRVAAKAPIRRTVNALQDHELDTVAFELGKAITRAAGR